MLRMYIHRLSFREWLGVLPSQITKILPEKFLWTYKNMCNLALYPSRWWKYLFTRRVFSAKTYVACKFFLMFSFKITVIFWSCYLPALNETSPPNLHPRLHFFPEFLLMLLSFTSPYSFIYGVDVYLCREDSIINVFLNFRTQVREQGLAVPHQILWTRSLAIHLLVHLLRHCGHSLGRQGLRMTGQETMPTFHQTEHRK